jgi:hypothetical protein
MFVPFFKNLNVEINTYKNYFITPHFFLNSEFTVIIIGIHIFNIMEYHNITRKGREIILYKNIYINR